MAIEITTFVNYGNYQQSWGEVGSWLRANATEYFPGGIVDPSDGSWCWYCYPIENDTYTLLKIPFNMTGATQTPGMVRAKNMLSGQIYSPVYNSPNTGYTKAAKTDNGFCLCHQNGSTLFVSKTTEGHICAYAIGTTTQGNSHTYRSLMADLEIDSALVVPYPSYSSVSDALNRRPMMTDCPTTSLLPMAFHEGTYSENLFMTHYTQAIFNGDLQKVLIDGEEYVYDGFIALKG